MENSVKRKPTESEESSGEMKRQKLVEIRRDCPYLDTVNRHLLDFDFEKFCSIPLSNLNVYACLVCGKFYQGRGLKSHAYTHSLEADHHVFINLHTKKAYCLPEIDDPSLDNIRHVLNPRFTKEEVGRLDENCQWSGALDGTDFHPGTVELNNIKQTDFVNVTIQSLMRVAPLRNFFLIPENYKDSKSPVVHRFGELTRKIWNAINFKGHVSPHEFIQAVISEGFQIGAKSDPVKFMSWLLNTLHSDLRKSSENKKNKSSIIYDCFRGELEVVNKENDEEQNVNYATSRVPFLMLGLDLPSPPLSNSIPQIPLLNLLKKFGGGGKYRIVKLPKYLILHILRFTENNFFIEKNATLVRFSVKNLDLKEYVAKENENNEIKSKYDLVANIVHDGKPNEGSYRVFVHRKTSKSWFVMQDLHVTEALSHSVESSEAYVQIYEQLLEI